MMTISLALALALSISAPRTTLAVCTPAKLRSSVVAEESAKGAVVPIVRAPDTLKLVGVKQFDGPCAVAIRASLMDQVLLTDGRVFERPGGDQTYSARPNEGVWQEGYDKRSAAEKSRPLIQGKGPIRTDQVTWPGGYVGVWITGKEWIVASFILNPDGSFTKPQAILTSSKPIRSASYFPAPDTNAGRLEIVQVQDDGAVWGLAFDWEHNRALRPV